MRPKSWARTWKAENRGFERSRKVTFVKAMGLKFYYNIAF